MAERSTNPRGQGNLPSCEDGEISSLFFLGPFWLPHHGAAVRKEQTHSCQEWAVLSWDKGMKLLGTLSVLFFGWTFTLTLLFPAK